MKKKGISRYYDNSDDYGNDDRMRQFRHCKRIHRHQPEVKHPQTAVRQIRQKIIIPSVFLSLQSTGLLTTAVKDFWKV